MHKYEAFISRVQKKPKAEREALKKKMLQLFC
jgi:hypothetical protein